MSADRPGRSEVLGRWQRESRGGAGGWGSERAANELRYKETCQRNGKEGGRSAGS